MATSRASVRYVKWKTRENASLLLDWGMECSDTGHEEGVLYLGLSHFSLY